MLCLACFINIFFLISSNPIHMIFFLLLVYFTFFCVFDFLGFFVISNLWYFFLLIPGILDFSDF